MMRIACLILFVLIAWMAPGQDLSPEVDSTEFSGIYQGKDLYLQVGQSEMGFCVVGYRVNGEIPPEGCSGSPFELTMNCTNQLSVGDSVRLKIYHHRDCRFMIINPHALGPVCTFEIVSIGFDDAGKLEWITKNESGKLPYAIQQFKWNKWVTVGEVIGTGKDTGNVYSFSPPMTSGENFFRVVQFDQHQNPRISDRVKFVSTSAKVVLEKKVIEKDIVFSDTTGYEIYDARGNIVKKGRGKTVNCSNLKKGDYYVNYDNTTATVKKR